MDVLVIALSLKASNKQQNHSNLVIEHVVSSELCFVFQLSYL